ncbi:MAG: 50S ribosomal protein L1 [Vulcanisaeta sp.]|uniref:50S ribosomal protein L1 n=1 Tax=Vulcanisaeta sp. EB80 TaxID=1650660 RepID=UPI0009C039B1|nr:50S ribosomal protein L1 [Vulcanisaeta sp. EB80]MCG2864650.1 50S ribosomal protein L1 [Vulcanisaeta sp.]MCG2866160.1 50S ribosomal protein L1 [Vulcanisaeta sp.]MCG2885763.1 50S ribosomal protein L1 [Vulcanisaeta sp.]MDT7969574.1 50S ribosomal protein L1 [Vulcanisaeta sp.]PLC67578.1 50S ribosomal protein L1 [Vulcanisaeta sp. EB80]
MSLDINAVMRAVEEAKAKAKKRRFKQSYELIVRFRDFDVKNQNNRFNVTVVLPHPLQGKTPKVCVMATGAMVLAAKEANADAVLTREDIEKLAGNKKEIRKLAQSYDYFVATPDLMVLIGRVMGQILGPRNKMPEVVQPNADIKAVIERLRRSVRVRVKDQPQIMCRVGTEDMDSKQVAENIVAVLEEVLKRVRPEQLGEVSVKLTMGPPITFSPLQQK